MYISKKNRELVRNMFDGKCAYTGTELQSDWQVDHVKPVRRNWWLKNSAMFEENHKLNNMLPSQRIINHYKQSMDLEQFRNFMKDFHVRVSKLPKNPKIEKSIKRKIYILEIARLFDIKTDKAFSGIFYFETLS
jgi:5-methylcytosine-specific restriction endonuclease McrA